MKKIIAYPIIHLFLKLGDLFYNLSERVDTFEVGEIDFENPSLRLRIFNILYNISTWFTINSWLLQNWAKLEKPWKEPDVTNNN